MRRFISVERYYKKAASFVLRAVAKHTPELAQQVVDAGNLLGNHFFKKRYQEDGLVAHARLSDGSVLIFRGKDQKGRMALLRLSNPQPNAKKGDDLKITLTLSYIEKPGQPDTYHLNDEDF